MGAGHINSHSFIHFLGRLWKRAAQQKLWVWCVYVTTNTRWARKQVSQRVHEGMEEGVSTVSGVSEWVSEWVSERARDQGSEWIGWCPFGLVVEWLVVSLSKQANKGNVQRGYGLFIALHSKLKMPLKQWKTKENHWPKLIEISLRPRIIIIVIGIIQYYCDSHYDVQSYGVEEVSGK